MTQTFLHAVAHSIDSLSAVNTKYGEKVVAEIQIKNMSKQTFWVSLKQGKKLQACFDFLDKGRGYSTNVREVHLVLEKGDKGLRFVWAGTHTAKKSELKFLEEKFGIKAESPYVGRPDLENAEKTAGEVDESLVDAE